MRNRFAELEQELAPPRRRPARPPRDARPSAAQSLPSWAERRAPTAFSGTLRYGVEGGTITDPFYRNPTEKQRVSGRSSGRPMHLGIDVSLSNAQGGGADDTRRGLPVYVSLRPTIDLAELNAIRVMRDREPGPGTTGLGLSGSGPACLVDARVHAQPWDSPGDAYGGVLGLGARYSYTDAQGAAATAVLYVEWLHLITNRFLPKDGSGRVMSAAEWAATGKGIDFGPDMRPGAVLTTAQLTQDPPLLIGYLGATQYPHVHIQAAHANRQGETPSRPRIDPAVILT